MRIAVTYENGQIFQHFGHTEEFKVYEVEDGKVIKKQSTLIPLGDLPADEATAELVEKTKSLQ